jgi:hypothetical protein
MAAQNPSCTLFLEARVSAVLLEGGLKRGAKVDNRFLHGAVGDIEHPRLLLSLECFQLPAQENF